MDFLTILVIGLFGVFLTLIIISVVSDYVCPNEPLKVKVLDKKIIDDTVIIKTKEGIFESHYDNNCLFVEKDDEIFLDYNTCLKRIIGIRDCEV